MTILGKKADPMRFVAFGGISALALLIAMAPARAAANGDLGSIVDDLIQHQNEVMFGKKAVVAEPVAQENRLDGNSDGNDELVPPPKHKSHKIKSGKHRVEKTTEVPVPEKPSVVAPLEPTNLGTLPVSGLSSISQAGFAESLGTPQQRAVDVQQAQQAVAQRQVVQQPQPQNVASAPVAAPAQNTVAAARDVNPPTTPVGIAPPDADKPPDVPAIPNLGGVLTPRGNLVLEPFLQYSRSSVNNFTFNGVQVFPAFLVGAVNANRTGRDILTTGATTRLGVNDRLEVEAYVPLAYRYDSVTNTIPNASNQFTTNTADGYGLGDLEFAGHYQINNGQDNWPYFIGNLRFKTDTGSSPYTQTYRADGSAKTLATGSGFMAVSPSVTMIYPSEPAVLFANLGYTHNFGEDINRTVAGNFINSVEPGDVFSTSFGMGVSLNQKLSFTLGYQHDYVRPTRTVIAGVGSDSSSLQVGSALTGISYKLTDRTNINLNVAAGVTNDAPDTVVTLRVPIQFKAF